MYVVYQLCAAQVFLPFFALHQVLNSNTRECFSAFIRVHFPLFVQLVLDYLEVKQGRMLSKRKGSLNRKAGIFFLNKAKMKINTHAEKKRCGDLCLLFKGRRRLFLKSFLYVSAFIIRVSFLFIKQTSRQDFFHCSEKGKK